MNGAPRLFDVRMADGSRHFADFAETRGEPPDWDLLHAAVALLQGAVVTAFVTDRVTEAWLDFTCDGEHFALNNQHGDWWCFVQRVDAPAPLLARVAAHFAAALQPPLRHLLAAGAVPAGGRRVLVHEPDGRVHCRDFADPAAAARYAADCAWEGEHGAVLATVFDERLQPVPRAAGGGCP